MKIYLYPSVLFILMIYIYTYQAQNNKNFVTALLSVTVFRFIFLNTWKSFKALFMATKQDFPSK